jgi:hypothetical protein
MGLAISIQQSAVSQNLTAERLSHHLLLLVACL